MVPIEGYRHRFLICAKMTFLGTVCGCRKRGLLKVIQDDIDMLASDDTIFCLQMASAKLGGHKERIRSVVNSMSLPVNVAVGAVRS